MSENIEPPKHEHYVREQASGFLENIGVKYYRHMAKKAGIGRMAEMPIDDLPPAPVQQLEL